MAQRDSFDYICQTYGVPARVGARVTYKGQPGTITGTSEQYILVTLDGAPAGEKRAKICHPTWEIVYLDAEKDAELVRLRGEVERLRTIEAAAKLFVEIRQGRNRFDNAATLDYDELAERKAAGVLRAALAEPKP